MGMMIKYVRVMADYCSTGLWDENGVNACVEGYNLSPETINALAAWCHEYELNDDYLPFIDRKVPAFDVKAFSERGLEVAKMIKRDLTDWKVIYFDEYALSLHKGPREDRAPYEYEVN